VDASPARRTTDIRTELAGDLRERYVLERELGRGGMAIVYLARDLRHERSVALKVFRPDAAGALGADRFHREIRVTAALQHPNILPVFDSGRSAGQAWYTMPFVAGESLRRRLQREGTLPAVEAVALAREIADALAYAHGQGVVHRDIKPENVLLSGGHALVADFGVARLLGQRDAELTMAGHAVGSPAYMSPEQVAGEPVDGRADLYALGCVLFEMLAGRAPFTGPNAQAVMSRRLLEPAPDLAEVQPDTPAWVSRVVRRALARDPAERFASASELARSLAEPVAAPDAPRRADGEPSTLVEREECLETLERALRSAAAGRGAMVVVSGEAGIGKTAVLEEFTRAERPIRLLWGWCEALFTPRPLGPLYDIAAQLGGALDAALRNGSSRETIFATVLDELGRSPTVLVLEDVHWADEATLDLLKFLGRRASRLPLLVIVTVRDDEVGPAHPLRSVLGDLPRGAVHRVKLQPLSAAAVETLARRVGRSPRGLHAATAGNPFYVTEVLAARQRGIPATVRDAVLGRATRLSPKAREALETVSVIPGKTESWLVEHLLGPDSAVDECFAAGMLTSDQQGVGFRNDLARRAVEESLAPARRRGLHARALAALESAPSPAAAARLVHHAEGAGDAAAVQRWVTAAAERASALGAHREAAAHYALGLRFAEGLPPERRGALLEGRSYEEYQYGLIPESMAAREEALAIWRRLGNRRREGAALRWLSRLAWSSGQRQAAERYAAEAVAVLEPLGPSPELAWAYSNRSQLHMLAAETTDAVAWGEKAIAMAETLGDGEVLVHALTNVGTAQIRSLRPEDGYAKLGRALRLAGDAGYQEHVSRCYANFTGLVVDKRYSEARRYLDQGLEYTEARDLDFWTTYLRTWRAQLFFDTGAWSDAEREATALLEHAGTMPVARIHVLCVLGRLRAARGEDAIWEMLDKAKALADRTAELQRLGPVAIARAEAAWLGGDPARAAVEARPAYELSAKKDHPWIRGVLAVWLHRAGALDQVPEELPRACALEIEGDPEGAAAEWERLGCPYDQALALAHGGASDLQARAARLLEPLGASATVRAIRAI
jgi:tetratricopeptide (TPR) repeat protein